LTFMGISPGKSKSNVVEADQAAFGKLAFNKILYRASFFVALLICAALSAASVSAQEERPQITPGERKATRKKDAGPRAVGVLQIAPNGKASLVPIAILVGGKFWDATAYKADPVPMALEPGTVYEAERAGGSLGLFTVNSALHSNAVNVQTPWIGTGAWVPDGAEKPKTALKAEKQPVGIDPTDAPPRLTRSGSTPQETPATTPAPPASPQGTSGSTGSAQTPPGQTNPTQASSTQSGSTQTTNPSPASPTPPGSSPTPASPTSSAPASPGTAKPTDSKPSDSRPTEAKPPERPSMPQSDSGAGEANRPRLRRGKPVEPLPEDEVPGYSKLGAVASRAPIASAGKNPEPTADKAPVQIVPAISDASGPEPKSFAFEWLKDEEGERLKQITALAKEQVRAYVEARAKAKIAPMPAPKSAGSQAARRGSASKTPGPKTGDPILENAQMKTFDLWGNNQPVMVFTADAHMPPPAASAAHSASDSDLQYSILLVANHDIYNNLHKLFVGVTDKYHLDINPRLELVDALDADGDSRGELLFREISDTGNGWIIYRATSDKLWKLFDSLNPE
jgi:hypothetical protein